MAGMKVKIDGKSYAVETDPSELTLGELELLQDHFGLDDMREYNFLVPRQITGVTAIAVRRAHEELDVGEVLEKARKLKYGAFMDAFNKAVEEEQAKAASPTEPAKAGKGKSPRGARSTPTT
jgi:hypothetical protein